MACEEELQVKIHFQVFMDVSLTNSFSHLQLK